MIGITGYGISVPYRRLDTAEIIDCWKNTALDLIKNKQGVTMRGVLGFDEDGNTLSVDAAKDALNMAELSEVEALIYGTCTNPYDSRPSATMLAEALDLPYNAMAFDIQFSTKSGTTALINAYALVKSGLAKRAMAIGADTINRHTAPGDLFEPYASAGACALTLGEENVIAEINGIANYSTDLSDGFRVEGERYIRSGMLPGSPKNQVGINDHTRRALEQFLRQTGTSAEDYTYVVLQQSTPGAMRSNSRALGLAPQQTEPAVFAEELGDTGSASALIGLCKVLDHAKKDDRILVISYGFGSGSDVLSLTVTEKIDALKKERGNIQKKIDRKCMVNYPTAMKFEYKYIRPEHMINAYL